MLKAGDLVIVDFPGIMGIKRRPAVVVSSDEYHYFRPDIVVAIITSQIPDATTPFDYVLQDWNVVGLKKPSAFRTFLVTLPKSSATRIGHCSTRDWAEIQRCLARGIAT